MQAICWTAPANGVRSWVTTTTGTVRWISIRVATSTSRYSASTEASGSSRISSSGSDTMARAISARCSWPPDSSPTGSPAWAVRPKRSSAAATAARSAAL